MFNADQCNAARSLRAPSRARSARSTLLVAALLGLGVAAVAVAAPSSEGLAAPGAEIAAPTPDWIDDLIRDLEGGRGDAEDARLAVGSATGPLAGDAAAAFSLALARLEVSVRTLLGPAGTLGGSGGEVDAEVAPVTLAEHGDAIVALAAEAHLHALGAGTGTVDEAFVAGRLKTIVALIPAYRALAGA